MRPVHAAFLQPEFQAGYHSTTTQSSASIDKLIADAARAPDLAALNDIWNTHQAFLRDTSEDDWVALKDAVNGRKAALEKRATVTPGKSSRVADILGAQAPAGGAA